MHHPADKMHVVHTKAFGYWLEREIAFNDIPRGIDPTTDHASSGRFTTELLPAPWLSVIVLRLRKHVPWICVSLGADSSR